MTKQEAIALVSQASPLVKWDSALEPKGGADGCVWLVQSTSVINVIALVDDRQVYFYQLVDRKIHNAAKPCPACNQPQGESHAHQCPKCSGCGNPLRWGTYPVYGDMGKETQNEGLWCGTTTCSDNPFRKYDADEERARAARG